MEVLFERVEARHLPVVEREVEHRRALVSHMTTPPEPGPLYPAAVDDYEREYMPGEGDVLHRQKAAIPRWVLAVPMLPGLVGVGVGAVMLATGGLALLPALAVIGGSAAYTALMGGIMVATGVTRVTVSEGALELQMGPGGVTIPLHEIERISVGDSGVRNVGIGKRITLDGTRVYSMLGDNARAVRIERASQPRVVIVCKEPDALVAAVEEARARAAAPRVRVATAEDAPDEVEASATRRERERGG